MTEAEADPGICYFCDHPIEPEEAVLAHPAYELWDENDRAHIECRLLNEALTQYGFKRFDDFDVESLVWHFAKANGGPHPNLRGRTIYIALQCGCQLVGQPEDYEFLLSPGNQRFDCKEHGSQWVASWSVRTNDDS